MKFTDGYWRMRNDVKAQFPVQAYDIEAKSDSFTVYATTRKVVHPGDTLNGALLTIEFSSPLADVIRVKFSHHAGHPPYFPKFVSE